MKRSRKMCALILCLSMLLVLFAGCGSDKGATADKTIADKTTADNTTIVDSSTQVQANTTEAKPVGPVEIGFTFWEAGWDGPEEGKDVIAPEIEKRTGVKIKLDHWKVTNQDDQKRQLGLWAATGDMPEVLFIPTDGYTVDLMNQMGEGDKLWDLTDYINKLTNFKDAVVSTSKFYSSRKTHKPYIYPTQINDFETTNATDNAQEGLIIRKDWLDKLGLAYPTTTEELYNVLVKFKTEIKSVNGKPVIPMLLGESLGGYNELLKCFVDASDRFDDFRFFAKDSNGQLTNTVPMAKAEAYVVFLNKLYRERLLDRESATLKDSQYQERMNSGRVGVTGQVWWNMTSYNDNLQKADPNALYVFMPFAKGPGVNQPVQQYITQQAPGGLVISKKLPAEKMDALFKLLDYMSSEEGTILGMYGLKGIHWDYNAENKIEATKEFVDKTKGDWNLGAHEGVGYYAGLGIFPTSIKPLLAATPTDKRADMIESKKNLIGTLVQANEAQDLVPPGPVENSKIAGIRTAWRDLIIKATIASSEAKCKEIINTWPDTWKKLGGDEVIKEKNDLFNASK